MKFVERAVLRLELVESGTLKKKLKEKTVSTRKISSAAFNQLQSVKIFLFLIIFDNECLNSQLFFKFLNLM